MYRSKQLINKLKEISNVGKLKYNSIRWITTIWTYDSVDLEPYLSFIINAIDETLDQFEASANHGTDLFQDDQFSNARGINVGSLLCYVTIY
jgi:hypothetical protein